MRNNIIGPGSPKNSVKAHGDVKLGKAPRKSMESKRARDTQGKTNGTKEPEWDKGARMGQRSPKAMKRVEDAQKNKMGQRSPKVIK